MEHKKGYMLTETVIAIAIILVMSFSFFSLCLFVNSNYQKSTITTLAINQTNNILTTFMASSFIQNESFSTTMFEQNLFFALEANSINPKPLTPQTTEYTINFDNNLSPNSDGKIKIVFEIALTENQVSFWAKVLKAEKQIYQMDNPFFKAVA
ncbi:MAG: hypothetical protein PHQ62_00975 [Clostridia bacterium]|nr:hypothetical protein [Clostridia bacterium]